MKTRAQQARRLQRIVNEIDYPLRPGLYFRVAAEREYDKAIRSKTPYSERGLVLWVTDWVQNAELPKSGRQVGRRWAVDPRLDADGIVRLAWEALLKFEEHEAREFFRYKGEKVFDPHKRLL